MKTPTEFDLQRLMHAYDPAYAREYYLRTRKLKGRDKAVPEPSAPSRRRASTPDAKPATTTVKPANNGFVVVNKETGKRQVMGLQSDGSFLNEDGSITSAKDYKKVKNWRDPRTGKSMEQIHKEARAKQRKELGERIGRLEQALKKLEDKIAKKIREEKAEDREGKAKKERARKEAEKPKTAAEKAEAARENEKYRKKNQQKLKNKSNDDKDSTDKSSTDSGGSGGGSSVSELKSLATKVKGKIQVAKQKLAAL